ncbi:MlaE family ABC transporter permease [Tuwongella immobilis]|uniref:ABC transporter permease n=1 Tax=Tuwongella immobilis TaxID=692036 RepID=A0A6C2YJU7_9BACT|nr:ABC transporter permease [Tuwongella immobilis]VIP01499.1 abc transporter permease : ABC-type transport system involved in resistance to organic solvents, permease component OS=Singulisphaera acidiphila (strain ATCC BAA-1392 / DSM 18658 / VKM B-2454 / MOB10) GN=Sinac_1322 PE=4 SV=1: Permease [Tuwongella immobilis]VTR98589.1 abc transporter permease : ABC-type transport system involved in resistance to organic solvents, permease component OS=Singulisphaera acidiphila (strain ATCC BAA-1392 / DSM
MSFKQNLTNRLVHLGRCVDFALRCLNVCLASFRQVKLVALQLYDTLSGSLLLATVTGVALGAVVWMHGHNALARTGSGDYLPTILAVAVILELAPIGAGLILAARTGAHLGAELGSMKITEQIDALEILGVDPMRRLVGPRILACVIALPMLNVLIAGLAIFTGYFAEAVWNQMTWLNYQGAFLTGNRSELMLGDVIPALLKTLLFGFLVGAVGCYQGLHAKEGTEGVGNATTAAVSYSALAVILCDVVVVGTLQLLK